MHIQNQITRFVAFYGTYGHLEHAMRDMQRCSSDAIRIARYTPPHMGASENPRILVIDTPSDAVVTWSEAPVMPDSSEAPVLLDSVDISRFGDRPSWEYTMQAVGVGMIGAIHIALMAQAIYAITEDTAGIGSIQFNLIKDRSRHVNCHRASLVQYMELTKFANPLFTPMIPFTESVLYINATGNPENDIQPGDNYSLRTISFPTAE